MTRIGIDTRLTYYRGGGITTYIEEIVKALPALDASVQYTLLQSRRDQRDLTSANTQRRARLWTPAHHRWERLTLAVEALPLGLDLLHNPDFIPAHRLGGWKSVITIHDLTFLRYPEFLTAESRAYYNHQIHAAARDTDYIMTDSEATRRDVLDLLNVSPDRVRTVLLGLSEHFTPCSAEAIGEARQKHDLPGEYILFVGTFEPRKNLDGLLRAYALLAGHNPDLPVLVVVGRRGWLYEDIYALVEQLKLHDRVLWRENIPYADLPALYSGALLLCQPSFYEGFGFPPLEAMACGTPAVVANRASLPEVVGEAGILIDPDHPESIAEGIEGVLDDSILRQTLRVKGLAHAARFTWNRTASDVLDVYRYVLGIPAQPTGQNQRQDVDPPCL